ncbi:NUDIX hydrolase [Halorarum halobium]|uniref:NUDIX hydrolase n=1 Tax=Halorarum halobium TaxID=3075121 RepID=UPI0028A90BA9|nr:NUDIX hydrolase [Halobaculum sp. XH14]
MIAESSRRAVDRALDSLRERFDEVPVVEETWRVDAETYGRTRERAEAGTVGGAGAWVRRGDGAALMVREVGSDGWSEPAGKQEPGEPLAETAVRETREETGIDCRPVGVVRAAVAVHEHADRPPITRLVVVFDARYEGGDVRPEPGEIAEARWVDEQPNAVRYPAVREFPL